MHYSQRFFLKKYKEYYDYKITMQTISESVKVSKAENYFTNADVEELLEKFILIKNEELLIMNNLDSLTSEKPVMSYTARQYFQKLEKDYPDLTAKHNDYPTQILGAYYNYRLEVLKSNLNNLNDDDRRHDPFYFIQTKYKLDNDMTEILIYLFFSNFEGQVNRAGHEILDFVYGTSELKFMGQKHLFIDARLMKLQLVKVEKKRGTPMSSLYAILDKANIIISGMHKLFPGLADEWKILNLDNDDY